MLQLPENNAPFVVVGIDPGTTTLGVSVVSWEIGASHYEVRNAFTLQAGENETPYQSMIECHGSRMARLQSHHDWLQRVLADVRPHAVISEAPFLNRRLVTSFEALTQCMVMIRQAVYGHNPVMALHTIDPISAKKSIGMVIRKGMDKDDVRHALAADPTLHWHVPLASLDEHATDAVAVAMYYYRNLL